MTAATEDRVVTVRGKMRDPQVQIPVIDISPSNQKAPGELLSAASTYGFVFVKNSKDVGIPVQDIKHVFELSQEFFASSTDVKEAVSISSNKAGKNHGWLGQGIEKLDPATQQRPDCKEAFNLAPPTGSGTYDQPIPTPLEPHVATLTAFQTACHALCQRIFTHLATALEIPATWFTSRHEQSLGPSGSVFRLLYYPQLPNFEDGVDIRAGAHSDFGSITLLFQMPGQPGLEIKTPTGEWAAVPVDPSGSYRTDEDDGRPLPILVNVGDLLEDWTGGLLKSTVHRVIFPKEGGGGDRYSIAYFCHPLDDAKLEPVPSEKVRAHATEHGRSEKKVLTAGEHLGQRLAATYKVSAKYD